MTSAISIRTDRTAYRPSDPVTLTIVNGSGSQYFYNPCTRVLERENAGSWAEVREERMCTMIAHLLDARETATDTTDLGEGLREGRYRMVLLFTQEATDSQQARSVRAVTAPFTVNR